jgi:hypothetical protein
MDNKKFQKVPNIYNCDKCYFTTCRKSQYDRHILTDKHKRITMDNEKVPKNDKKHKCLCGKEYNYASGLCKHKIKCIKNKNNDDITHDFTGEENNKIKNENNKLQINFNDNDSNNNKNNEINELKNMIKDLMKQNNELVKTITDITPKIGNTITNTNCNNKTFNLQFFLNETCKNAMNLNQFVNNIDITMDDLKNTRINGLVEGVSDIIIRGLKQLEIHERPIHCTDLKRDTLYIKDNEKWTKDENNEIFKETIEEIIEKEQEALNLWTDAHPDWDKITHLQDEYVLMVNRLYQPVMEDEKKEKKIIHNISKEVYIQK